MRVPIKVVALGLAVCVQGSVFAASGAGTDGASFLNIPVGAGPAALGSAYTALASDAYAPVYNPAGLGFVRSLEFSAQHLSYLESMHYEFGSVVVPLGKSRALGVSVQYLGSGDIAEVDPDGNALGQYSAHYAASSLAYGQKVSEKVSVGLTGKWINAKLADVSANAYGADVGAMVKARENLNFAATVKNIGNKLKFQEQDDTLPQALHLGAAWRINKQLKLAADALYRKVGSVSGRFGAEWRPLRTISLRTGYKTDTTKELSALAGLSAGIGIHVWGQELAYAWLPYGDLGDTQYLSLIARLGQSDEEKRNLVQFQSIQRHRTAKNRTSSDSASEPDYQQLLDLFEQQDEKIASGSHPQAHPQ